jgi:hypothetical protein
MKTILKSVLAVAAFAGATAALPMTASAGVGVTIGIGVPGYGAYGGYSPYEGDYYYDPIFVSGAWYHGPYRWRMYHGERMFWLNGRWQRNEWRNHTYPASITFRNGGYYRGGHYDGFDGAERFNARFEHRDMREDRRDRREMNSDRRDDREHDDMNRDDGRDHMRDGRNDDRNDGSDR